MEHFVHYGTFLSYCNLLEKEVYVLFEKVVLRKAITKIVNH